MSDLYQKGSLQKGSGEPLGEFPLLASRCVEETEEALSRSLATCQIKSRSNRFGVKLNGVNLGRVSLSFNCYESEATVESTFPDDTVFFVLGCGEASSFKVADRRVQSASNSPAMIAHARKMEILRPGQSGILVLRSSLADLDHQLDLLSGHRHRGGLEFDLSADLSDGPGGALMRLMHLLGAELRLNPAIAKNAAFRRGYEEALLNALISLPHNRQHLLFEGEPRGDSGNLVARAQDYMRANLRESITVSDLLKLCRCSRGTLFGAFRKACDYSPMEFLTEQRLHAARKELLDPHALCSVSAVAVDSGFVHLGRFASAYRKRFGESPSQSLARSKRRD